MVRTTTFCVPVGAIFGHSIGSGNRVSSDVLQHAAMTRFVRCVSIGLAARRRARRL